eukprot:6889759-Lingulodinium_polyedra.AAC.1
MCIRDSPPELPVLAKHRREHGRAPGMVRDEAREIRGLGRTLVAHAECLVSALLPGRHGAGPT